MNILILVIVIFLYGAFEFIGSLLFNWRLMLLSEKKFVRAGWFASVSTIMFISSIVIASWLGLQGGDGTPIWWIVPCIAISMGIGNYLAAICVPKIREKLSERKNKAN